MLIKLLIQISIHPHGMDLRNINNLLV